MTNRILARVAEAKRRGEKLFCAYLTLGYPSLSYTRDLIREMEALGVDLIELGFPFSDPLADGPVIQAASEAALRRGVGLADSFRVMRQLRRQGTRVPVIFFSYYNPIFHYGLARFARAMSRSGFDGLISPDLPPDEERELPRLLRERGLSMVYLVAPTTERRRIGEIARRSSGFLYYVSLKGVTGLRPRLARDVAGRVRGIKHLTAKPVLVGFGVSTPAQAREAARISDGVIVGSAIIKAIRDSRGDVKRAARSVRSLVRAVKKA